MKHKPTSSKNKFWAELFRAWLVFLPNFLEGHYGEYIHAPLLISEKHLRKAKYIQHFPQHLFRVEHSSNGVHQYITPATCLHYYPVHKNKKIKDLSALMLAHCARAEGGKWQPPYRLSDFHMLEVVLLGSEKFVAHNKKMLRVKVQKLFSEFGFNGDFENATDAFFLGDDDGAKVIQKIKNLKEEYAVQDGKKPIALASANNHEQFFGKNFNIRHKGSFAYSSCIAFGIERLTTYSLKVWGKDKKNWPKKFKKYAHLS